MPPPPIPLRLGATACFTGRMPAFRRIMLRGAPITALWLPFVVLTVMALVVFTGATLRFRRDLAPGRPASPARKQPAAAETVSTA